MKIPFTKNQTVLFWQLGTCGYRTNTFHRDYFFGWRNRASDVLPPLRRFTNDGIMKRWETLTLSGWQIDKIQVIDPDNAARIFRRTMKPYTLLQHRFSGQHYWAMSYPCPNEDGRVTIMVRSDPDDPCTLIEARCELFDPVSFQATNVPAENPIPAK
jgi:hypothetical protein